MKKILLLFFLSISISYSQTAKGIIIVQILKSSGDETRLSKVEKEPIYYDYIYSNQISKQELISNNITTIDTLLVEGEGLKNLPLESIVVSVKPNKVIYYKNHINNIFRLESERLNENLVKQKTSIKDNIPIYEWSMVDESKTIAGFICKKATTTKNVGILQSITAWYCEDIAINDGPMDFSGLPRLIMQIEIGNNTIMKFEKIELLEEVNSDIKEPKNETEMITINQYLEKRANGG